MDKLVPLFPIAAAILYGLSYATYPAIMKQIPFWTFMVLTTAFNMLVCFAVAQAQGENVLAFTGTMTLKQWAIIGGFSLIILSAWGLTLYASGKISPSYAAVGEISYVLFTPFFSWLLFNDAKLDRYTLIAAVLILAGSAVLIYGKTANTAGAIDAHL